MSEEGMKFDRELGELVQLHRIARGLSQEELADKLGLPTSHIERYEAGSNRLSVFQYCAIISALDEDPSEILGQLQDWISVEGNRTESVRRSGVDFMTSKRGRKVINALAMCDEPDVQDALADLILAIGMHTRAGTRVSDLRASTRGVSTKNPV